MAKKLKKMSIKDRLDLLEEAELFFSDLTEAGEEDFHLGLRKAAALGTVRLTLKFYQGAFLNGADRTEKTLEQGMKTVIVPDFIEEMITKNNMTEKEASFYEGGFGLAIGILEGDKEQINHFRKTQEAYDDLVEAKYSERTIADLLR